MELPSFIRWFSFCNFTIEKANSVAVFLSPSVNNPIYDRGASETLKLAKINHRGDEDEEEGPEYQPLVENTKPRERIDSVPGYRTLSFDQTTNQQKGPGTGVRSSNYLSLIKDDVEEGSDYQTLVKDGNPKVGDLTLQSWSASNFSLEYQRIFFQKCHDKKGNNHSTWIELID